MSQELPPPPVYYQLYGAKNVDPEGWMQGTFQQDWPQVIYRAPKPPKPPQDGPFVSFNTQQNTQEVHMALEDGGLIHLYNIDTGDKDVVVKQLKKLSHSALFNFLELLDVLVTNADEIAERTHSMTTIFFNIHHLINSFRSRQATKEIIEILQEQIDRRKNISKELLDTVNEIQDQLRETLNSNSSGFDTAEGDIEIEMENGGVKKETEIDTGETEQTQDKDQTSEMGQDELVFLQSLQLEQMMHEFISKKNRGFNEC